MDMACPSVCSVTLTHPPVKLNPAIQVSFLSIYRNKMSSQKVSLQQIHRQRLEQSTGQKYLKMIQIENTFEPIEDHKLWLS